MATLNSMVIVFVHMDLLVRHQYLAGPLRKGVINAALRRVLSYVILKKRKKNNPLLSNPGLKLIPDFRHLRRKRCNGELMGKKNHKKDYVISGLMYTFLLPLFSKGRLYIDSSFHSLFK